MVCIRSYFFVVIRSFGLGHACFFLSEGNCLNKNANKGLSVLVVIEYFIVATK